jgi:hypothetical protein
VIRRVLVVAATLLGVVAFVPAVPAQAIPHCRDGYACLYQWWADQEHTVFNGFLSIDCDGTATSSGRLTGFLVFGDAQCGSTNADR